MKTMLVFSSLLLTFCWCVVGVADEPEVRAFFTNYSSKFNDRSVDELAAMWSEDAVHFDRETGQRTLGRQAIRADLAATFESAPSIRIAGEIDEIKRITPSVANVQGVLRTTVMDEPPTEAVFSVILVKHAEGWQIASADESPRLPKPTPYDGLRPLEWLIGDWVDRSEGLEVISSFRWSDQQTFLVRSIAERSGDQVTRLGTQLIGWDPRSQQIRSWTFNADGSFGNGTWSESDGEWMIKSSQTLPNGNAASGTYVLSRLGDDKLTLRLIGHQIDGQPLPSPPTATLTRAESAEVTSAAVESTAPAATDESASAPQTGTEQ
jgi:uncharacterized protein (TIGR02246 family)